MVQKLVLMHFQESNRLSTVDNFRAKTSLFPTYQDLAVAPEGLLLATGFTLPIPWPKPVSRVFFGHFLGSIINIIVSRP